MPPTNPPAAPDPTGFIPFHRPSWDESAIDAVADVIRSGWWTTGQVTAEFEERFAERVGARHAMAVNSCTAAMHLALDAAGVQAGTQVITSVFTFTATAEVIAWMGATPLFVDVDPATMNLDPEQVEAALKTNNNITAILPVHFAGLACDLTALRRMAEAAEVPLVADAAHAFPTRREGQTVGGDLPFNAFSFYVTKTLATGEGGMLTLADDDAAERVRTMRLHGIDRSVMDRYTSKTPAWFYQVTAPGFKYNLTDMASALGLHQLRQADVFHQRRQQIASQYDAAFADLPVDLPPRANFDDHSWHLYVLRFRLNELRITRDRFIEAMSAAGIGTSVHFIPLHRHPWWRDQGQLTADRFPAAEATFESCVSLPIYPDLSAGEMERIVTTVHEILDANRA